MGVNRWLKIVWTGTCKISGLGPTAPWPFYFENLLSQLTAGCTVELACWVSLWSLQSDRLIYICRSIIGTKPTTINCKRAISFCSQNHYRSRSLSSPVANQEQTGTKYTCPLAATSERPAQVSHFLCLAPKQAGAAHFIFQRVSGSTDPLRLPSQSFTGRTL